jgi:hypothetical protein
MAPKPWLGTYSMSSYQDTESVEAMIFLEDNGFISFECYKICVANIDFIEVTRIELTEQGRAYLALKQLEKTNG